MSFERLKSGKKVGGKMYTDHQLFYWNQQLLDAFDWSAAEALVAGDAIIYHCIVIFNLLFGLRNVKIFNAGNV